MLCASGVSHNMEEAEKMLRKNLESGAGLSKLAEMIAAQGGDPRVTEDLSLLPQAPVRRVVTAERAGIVSGMDTMRLGYIAQGLGAGRRTKEDVIDPAVGFIMHARLGDTVSAGDPLAEIHARKEDDYEQAAAAIRDTVRITDSAPCAHPLIYAAVTREGTRMMH